MISVRRIAGALVAIVAVPLSVVSVAAFFGDLDWRLDLIANGRVQLWWIGGVLTLLALPTRSAVAITSAAAVALVNLAVVAPLYLPPGGDAAGEPVRILSFNLLSTNDRYDEVVGYIRETEPDLVFLHEGTALWEEALGGFFLPDYEIVSGRTEALIFGTIALVPPGSTVENLGFRSQDPRGLVVTLDGLEVLGAHPLPPVSGPEASRNRAQLATYAEWAATRDGPAVVVGDLNATPWAAGFRELEADGDLENSQRGFGVAPTWEVGRFWAVPIDHLLHSDDLVTVDRVVGPDLGSDHRPLLVEVAPAG
ncbi:MAG: endonuclease/exonuclease/phosphatase family protein [Acidimicrobiia bacterium]